jgi:uncharacterized phage protein gp47/JayE
MANSITVAAPPNTTTIATQILAAMAAQSGVVTDFNKGSQIRTLSEAQGMIGEMQGVISQAEAFQTIVYSAFTAFNIFPNPASSAVGLVTFATGFGSTAPPTNQAVLIPSGTLVQTTGGVQFVTTQNAILPAGSVSINIPVQAVQTGTGGNVSASAINQIISGLPYPLSVSNLYPTSGGAAAESPQSVLSRFTAAVASVNGATPVSIANAVIGVTVSGTSEAVKFSTVYELWVTQMAAGITPLTPGYAVYVDNGGGSASQALLDAVEASLNGTYPDLPGNRPAGVPYTVNAVVPLPATVVVNGTPFSATAAASLTTSVQNAMAALFNTLLFGVQLEASQVIAAVANSIAGGVSGLTVTLEDGSGNVVTALTPSAIQRIILQTLTINFGG